MGNTTRHKKKNKKELQEGLKKKTSSSPARGKLLEKQGGTSAPTTWRSATTIMLWSDVMTELLVHATRLWPNMLLRVKLANRPRA